MERIAKETEEDLQKLSDKIKEVRPGTTVFRTKISDDWEKDHGWGRKAPYPPMTPRDHTAMVGNTWFQPGGEYGRNFDVKELVNRILNFRENELDEGDEILGTYLLDLLKPGRNLDGVKAIEELRKSQHSMGGMLPILCALNTEEIERVVYSACTNVMGSRGRNMHHDFNYYKDAEEWARKTGHNIQYDKYICSANMMRLGKDLYFGLNNIVNYVNKDHFMSGWKSLFPDYRCHAVAGPGHNDGSCVIVKPGLIIVCHDEEYYRKNFPDWEVVRLKKDHWRQVRGFRQIKEKNLGRWWVPGEEDNDDLAEFISTWLNDWVLYVEETVFDINMLILDEQNIIVSNYCKEAFDAFERHGITPHIVHLRHRYFWDGGLHCVTSDLEREGTRQDYFPDRKDDLFINSPYATSPYINGPYK